MRDDQSQFVSYCDNILPGGHSEREPPDSIPNSEVKTFCADDSMGPPHVKVGHCQAFTTHPATERGFLCPF